MRYRDKWRKHWRKMWDNPALSGNPNRICVWIWILDHAEWRTEKPHRVFINGKDRALNRGELSCGRKEIARDTGVSEATVQRTLKFLENEHMIEQQTHTKFRLIQVKKWEQYQPSEQVSEQRVNNKRTTNEHITEEEVEHKNKKNTYVARSETKALYDSIEKLCSQYGMSNSVSLKGLDVIVERYVGKVRMKVELQHCVSWLIDKGLKSVSTQRIGNWFKKSQEIQKREQRKQMEWSQARNDPALKKKLKEEDLNQSVSHFAASSHAK